MTETLHSYIVVYEYDFDELMFFGPFSTMEAAETWMNEQPDDEDLMDMWVATMNSPELSDNNLRE
jgi:hypothetical protein